ncbi:MAG: hypothetical protein UT34_C0001G0334 [candidate division WS6 bacterium GW2011_GWF2_39_15]|uniref:Uncharacterized protein n=1 Tax=candidate division WS6 bacterium GW2011_GWF2_39_15 TaxID=1619100 RepID=A0A0G0MQI5_9BACT|nr:MAG: hypothetical protein UT34_C0001G0334 [candidate division WS6 bacterium GW2011_GWF2_39_15]
MVEEIAKLIDQLKTYGLDNAKLSALYQLAVEDFLEEVQTDLTEISDSDLTDIESSLKDITIDSLAEGNNDPFMTTLRKLYGAQAEPRFLKFLKEYFEDAVKQAQSAKELLEKYKANDPEVLKKLEEAKMNEDYDTMEAIIKSLNPGE